MTDPAPKWAELSREGERLLVPQLSWMDVTMRVIQEGLDTSRERAWDASTGHWTMSAAAAALLADAYDEVPASALETTLGAPEDGTLAHGTAMHRVFSPGEAEQAKSDVVAFLRKGAFAWRYVDQA